MLKLLKELNSSVELLEGLKVMLLKTDVNSERLKLIDMEVTVLNRLIERISVSMLEIYVNKYTARRFRCAVCGYENYITLYEEPEDYVLLQDIESDNFSVFEIYHSDIIFLSKNGKYNIFRLLRNHTKPKGLVRHGDMWNLEVGESLFSAEQPETENAMKEDVFIGNQEYRFIPPDCINSTGDFLHILSEASVALRNSFVPEDRKRMYCEALGVIQEI